MASRTVDEVYEKAVSVEAKADYTTHQVIAAKQLLEAKMIDLKKTIEAGAQPKPEEAKGWKELLAGLPVVKEIIDFLKPSGDWGTKVVLGLLAAQAVLGAIGVQILDLKKVFAAVTRGLTGGKEVTTGKSGLITLAKPEEPPAQTVAGTTKAVAALDAATKRLKTALQSLSGSLKTASESLQRFKSNAGGAATAAGKLDGSLRRSASQAKALTAAARGSASALRTLRTAADQAEKSLTRSGRAGQTAGTGLGKYQAGADKAAKGQDRMNKSMKGNFFGLLMGLLAPLIQKVVEMAARSKTMQEILGKAFAAVKEVIGKVMGAIGPIMQKAAKIIKDIWDGIKKAVEIVVKAVAGVIQKYFDIWKKIITTVLDAIKFVVDKVWNGIKNVIMPVIDWVKSAIPKAFQAVKDKLSDAWNGLKDIAGRAFDGIKNAVKAPINAVIGLINSAIDKLNSIKVSIPGWVPFVGGKTFGLSLPKIPTLAAGGVVLPRSGGVPAILAEAGEAEAVLPLSRLDRMLRNAAAQGRIGGDGATGTGGALHIENYYAATSSDPQRTADALMFLAKARGWRG